MPWWSILADIVLDLGVGEERMMLSRRRRVRVFVSDSGTAQISSFDLYVRKDQLSPLALRPSVTQSSTPSELLPPSLPSATSKTCFCAYPLLRKGCTGSGARSKPAPAPMEAVRFWVATAEGEWGGEGKILVEPCVVRVRRV